jgi:gamma-tubulin complex component 4
MNLLIENWRAYIQVDVIEPEFQKLLQTISSSSDFNQCTRAHRQYLAAVMAHSFLDVGSIMTIFEDIFALAREIFSTCSQYSSGQGLPADWEDRLSYLSRQFEKNSQELLTNLRAYVIEVPTLRTFLLRMSFNDHFENGSEGVNLTATQFDGLEM